MNRTQTLIRWSGLPLIAAAVMFPVYTLLHPVEETASAIAQSPWAAIHSLWYLGTIFTLLGLLGVYARQVEQSGRLGAAGFVLTLLGTAMLIGFAFTDGYVMPLLAVHAPALIDPQGPIASSPVYQAIFLTNVVLITAGAILFAIATFRANVLPRWGGLCFGIGMIAFEAGQGSGPVVGTLCALVFSVGLAWLGYALWAPEPRHVRRTQPAM